MKKRILFCAAAFALLLSCSTPENPSGDTPGGSSADLTSLPLGLSAIPETPSADASCTLYYRAGGSAYPFVGYTAPLYAHIGLVEFEWKYVQAQWNENIDKCKWQKVPDVDNLWALPIEPTVREWFGAGENEAISKIGVVVRNSDGSRQTQDLFVSVTDTHKGFTPSAVVNKSLPSGSLDGINYTGPAEVTLVLREKDSEGKHYAHCCVVGDFNSWTLSDGCEMFRDESTGCWWITLTGLTPGKEYRFQYHLIDSAGDAVRVADPYSEIIYSGDDSYISSSTYPSLPAYPSGTSGLVSAFQTSRTEYSWNAGDFSVSDPDNLIIYELHLRDFSASRDLSGAEARLDYIQGLGVNAIELLPVQEFDGNDSWGYSPCAYFALDKAYGTPDHYKAFIDECHRRGIAVLFDVVYNHATGAHPMAKMYWDATANKTAANNPWFNVDAPHPYSVYHDWNHENSEVRAHIKRSLKFLLDTYHVDGFRFDLTKGFTQKKSTESTSAAYDASRIAILKDYASAVFAANSKAVVIFEHFCDTGEERELAGAGVRLWRNMNNAYCQTVMGWLSDGDDLSGLWSGSSMPYGSLVSFQESHDEERTAYKALTWGNGITSNLSARMQREKLNAAFSLLVPGPKMLWQFEELGYDVSIDSPSRTGQKPLHWDYLEVPERKGLYDCYAALLGWRKANPGFYREDASFSWNVGSGLKIRTMQGKDTGGNEFFVVGNFDVADNSAVSVKLPSSGSWTDALGSETLSTASDGSLTLSLKAGEFRLLVKTK